MPPETDAAAPSVRWAVGGTVALLAIAVLIYGAPGLVNALASLKMQQTAGALLANTPVTPGQMQTALDHVRQLDLGRETPQQRAIAGYILLQAALAERVRNPAEARTLFTAAETALVAALRQRPADSYSWARLALVRLELGRFEPGQLEGGRAGADAMAAWRLSVITAPFEPPLAVWRLGIGLMLYDQMDPAYQQLVREQTRHAWQASRWRTARMLALYQRPELLRPQLASEPLATQQAFERSYTWFLQEHRAKRSGITQERP